MDLTVIFITTCGERGFAMFYKRGFAMFYKRGFAMFYKRGFCNTFFKKVYI